MATLSFALIHQQAHELEKGQTCLKEERIWQNTALLNLWSQLTPDPNSCIFRLFAGGSDPLLFIRQQGGMSSPDEIFLVQVSPMRVNICSPEESLSMTLHPYQRHGWMLSCSCWKRSILYHTNRCYSVSNREYSLWFMSLLWPLPCQNKTEDLHLLPEVIHVQLAGQSDAGLCRPPPTNHKSVTVRLHVVWLQAGLILLQ